MRKLLLCAAATALLLTGCGRTGEGSSASSPGDGPSVSEPVHPVTLDGIEQAIRKADPCFVFDEPAFYLLVDAKDGRAGRFKGQSVTVYQYSDGEACQEAMRKYQEIKEASQNGNFLLETSNDTVKQIFSSFHGDLDAVVVPKIPEVTVGQVNTIPNLCDFTVNYGELKTEVLPPRPTSFYTYYPEQDGKTYLDVSIRVKNTRTTARRADEFGTVKVICGAGYEYSAFSIIEEKNGGNFTYTNITNIEPLTTGELHYLASIPNELAEDASVPIVVELSILNHDYTMQVR